MIMSASMNRSCNFTSNKCHRHEVHKHADEYLAELEAKEALKKITKPHKKSLAVKYLTNLAEGLETMFRSVLRPL